MQYHNYLSNQPAPLLILGSTSPRRKNLLHEAGYHFDVVTSDIQETLPKNIRPDDAAMFLAFKKALSIKNKILDDHALKNRYSHQDTVILSSDTIVYLDNILGKPANKKDCIQTLKKLSGQSHYVYTAIALLWLHQPLGKVSIDHTKVSIKKMSTDDIYAYASTPEPYDKAGSYAIQGSFSRYIESYHGDFNTVVGLPTKLVLNQLPLNIYGINI